MPFDGISFTEAGYKITLPSELNIQAEMSAQTQAKTFVKKLDGSHKVQADGKNKQNSQKQNTQENNSDELSDENSPEFLNKSNKINKFKVLFNQSNDMVELIDRESGNIIETISPNDLLHLVSKSKTASGILVDRRI
ncbi:MAG: flagellar protein FlaG [bacterium]